MTELIENLKYEFMKAFIQPTVICILIVIMVSLSSYIDYRSGIKKATERGEKLLSSGFRRSITKVTGYYKFLLFGFMFDFFVISILYICEVDHKFFFPLFSMIFGLRIIRIEYRSMREKASDKIKNSIPILDWVEILKQPDVKSRLLEAVRQLEAESNPTSTDGSSKTTIETPETSDKK